jgi:hypothetical protein
MVADVWGLVLLLLLVLHVLMCTSLWRRAGCCLLGPDKHNTLLAAAMAACYCAVKRVLCADASAPACVVSLAPGRAEFGSRSPATRPAYVVQSANRHCGTALLSQAGCASWQGRVESLRQDMANGQLPSPGRVQDLLLSAAATGAALGHMDDLQVCYGSGFNSAQGFSNPCNAAMNGTALGHLDDL